MHFWHAQDIPEVKVPGELLKLILGLTAGLISGLLAPGTVRLSKCLMLALSPPQATRQYISTSGLSAGLMQLAAGLPAIGALMWVRFQDLGAIPSLAFWSPCLPCNLSTCLALCPNLRSGTLSALAVAKRCSIVVLQAISNLNPDIGQGLVNHWACMLATIGTWPAFTYRVGKVERSWKSLIHGCMLFLPAGASAKRLCRSGQ